MSEPDWDHYIDKIEQFSPDHPILKNFIRLIFSLFYLFPYLKRRELTQKNQLLNQLNKETDYWELEWIKQFFTFKISSTTKDFLIQEDWWWQFLSQI
ncbi:MAG: hypothetical protein JSV04_13825, partial [Candidatus Heimdallarchaeota archaeon]